jgi:hypothetical protein
MSGKSRRRGRKLSRSQRRRLGRVGATPLAQSVAIPQAQPVAIPQAQLAAQKPVLVPRAATVIPRAPAQKMALPTEPPHISDELKRIGVMAGIMAVLLVAAYFILH